jgi:hypothetical protein
MFRRLRSAIAELGPLNAVLYGLNRVFERARFAPRVFHYKLVVQPVLTSRLCPEGLGRDMLVRSIDHDEVWIDRMPITESAKRARLRQDTTCLGAFRNDEMIGYLWVCRGGYEEDEVRCRFEPLPAEAAVWDFDLYVFPQHRLGPAFARLWDETYSRLRAGGVLWTFSRISALNPRSLAVHRRLEARILGSAIFLKSRRFQLMLATVPPYVHVSVRSSMRPVIRLVALDGG